MRDHFSKNIGKRLPHSPQQGRPDDESHPVFVYTGTAESLLSMRSLYIQNRALLWPSLLQGPRGERQGNCELSEQIPISAATKSLRVREYIVCQKLVSNKKCYVLTCCTYVIC